jgi:ribosome biogenesis GTPase A
VNRHGTPIQWYPGHMAKAMRRIAEYLEAVDIVVEVVDARIAHSGRNPMLGELAARRLRLLVLTREDLADPQTTGAWIEHYAAQGLETIAADARSQRSAKRLASSLGRLAERRKGRSRAIVLGLPNAGKSSVINGILGRAAAKTEDRAGVTRQLQWFRVSPHVELMDTPGVLVPKISSPQAQWKLAVCGAVPVERYDPERVAAEFARWMLARLSGARAPRLQAFARRRGFLTRGGEIDEHTAARAYLRALQAGEFGRFSFEAPGDAQ